MESNVSKKLIAMFCLVSLNAYSKNNLEYKRDFNKAEVFNLLRKDTLIKASDNSSESSIIDSRVATTVLDWTKAPNSYIFDPAQDGEGLYVPVKKAYEMWRSYKYLASAGIIKGKATADVLWEDVPGLIKSGPNYDLEIVDSGESGKIKVMINKAKKGNAVIAFRLNGEIFWSWHIWVTDNPTNG